jgi:hypothetical protein
VKSQAKGGNRELPQAESGRADGVRRSVVERPLTGGIAAIDKKRKEG